ncbi:hypothetical protein K491DRAFT_780242 [Lophiostoma macrostomum CBS 122681]|uniref:Uncharacterized protein n=1 Tax=Lophiostoma macrostomum CBS 122681 TaxID=1314788 RepID=A0A6A6T3U9_9PLEO|nr:hypothetical protein K491DRAFT_780242 [Lophiostoma macrostomum CBS 122681]
MPDEGGDYLVDLTSAPIFEEALWLSEALHLVSTQTEDDLDSQLAVSARESGIEDPYRILCPGVHDVSTALSTMTVSSEHRSSMSIHSRESQSTGFTSHPSRTSKDSPYVEGSTVPRTSPTAPGTLSADDYYDTMMRRFRPSYQQRTSASSTSGVHSVVSNVSSSRKPNTRKQKRATGLGLFSMFRKDSSTCASRSHHGHLTKPLSPKLECGHVLSKYALRVHIQEALETKDQVIPNCCGIPLPRSVLETVLTKDEAEIVASTPLQSPTFSSLRDSGYSEDGGSSIDLPNDLEVHSSPIGTFVAVPGSTPRIEEEALFPALANEAFNVLKAQQKEQFQRISLFEANQRRALSAFHQWALKRLTSKLEANKEDRTKRHIHELERLDESQIVAEHDLRKAQDQEIANVATALKYMEAYCAGSCPSNSDIAPKEVTDEDRKKLSRQQLIQEKLPAKHESAINVLRARQEKDTRNRLQKQKTELQQLETERERNTRNEELQYTRDTTHLDALIDARRKRVVHRWHLQFEIWRRDWEKQHGTIIRVRLPHEEWPETPKDAPIDPSSPLALYLHIDAQDYVGNATCGVFRTSFST